MGESVVEIYGRDLTGCYADERMKQFPGAVVFLGLGAAARTGMAMEEGGFLINEQGRPVKYRACFLPCATRGQVTHIVAGLSGRVF